MSSSIRERYQQGFITDEQLDRYVKLGVVSAEDAAALRAPMAIGGVSAFSGFPVDEVETPIEEPAPEPEPEPEVPVVKATRVRKKVTE